MSCLGCTRMEEEKNLKALVTGEVVCSYCPAWLTECEARELLRLPLEMRRERLAGIEKKRGTAVEDLKNAMRLLHERKNEK